MRRPPCRTASAPIKAKEEEREARQEAAEAQLNALRALLPGILEKPARIKDSRRPERARHKLPAR